MKVILHIILFILLTVVTQTGGLVYLATILFSRNKAVFNWLNRVGLFVLLYLITTFMIVPLVAPQFGREPITKNALIKPVTFFTDLTNRNYVTPELNKLLRKTAINFEKKFPGIQTRYLDANFPFFDGFPLIPHLSHGDGKKIDLAFLYEANGDLTNKKRSLTGYGIFVEPRKNETQTTTACKSKGFPKYDYNKFFGISINKHVTFSQKGTKVLIEEILSDQRIQKIFIEPHLKDRLRLNDERIRFHGCQSVRHDDHIHIQI